MESAKLNYKLVKKVRDNRFEEENLSQYTLSIQIGMRDFQIGVLHSSDDRLLLLEDYVIGELDTSQAWYELIKDLFDSHSLLQAGFWKQVRICIKNNKFVQVPVAFFDKSEMPNYLHLNAHFTEDDTMLHYVDQKAEIVTVFAMPSEMHEWVSNLYKTTTLKFYHQSSVLVQGLLQMAQPEGESLYVLVDRFKLHIISIQYGKLVYYNQFIIRQFPDYVKYIMQVLKGLNMNQELCRIHLWGYIGKNTPHYQEFCRYIRNVEFGTRPTEMKFGYLFDEIQSHHFIDLFSTLMMSE